MTAEYSLANSSWGKEELEAMQKVIDSGNFTMGKKVKEFEKQHARYLGVKYCVMVNSGSSANLLMVAALFYGKNPFFSRGDEVIVPAVSWGTSYFPLYQYGLKLRFVDIDLNTLNYSIESLESAITSKTKLIMVVNILGNPNDFTKINEIAANHDLVVIEDNCESMGADFQGRKTGTFGVMGSFSTFFSHHISTMEGGSIVTDNEELYHILLSLRAHGWTRDLPDVNHVCNKKNQDSFIESFRFVLPGYNVRPLELEGAIGVEQLKKIPVFIENRRKNGARIQRVMKEHPDLLIQKEIGNSSWFGFSLVIRPGSKLTRGKLFDRLSILGFESRPIVAGNFSKSETMKYFDYEIPFELKNAEYIDSNGLFIGNHNFNMYDAIDKIAQIRY
jgi:CDP-6-deoxy-D-xylo-4-hexulose-3-dehydrase